MIEDGSFVPPKIFISHSAHDARLAEQLVDLIRAAFNLPSKDIRCTSVDGTRLPGGAYTDEQVRREVVEAALLIGIISQNAISSAYVLLEIGARWGANKPLIPVLAPDAPASILAGPLTGINALQANNIGELFQLVHDIGRVLEVNSEPAAAFSRQVDAILKDREQTPQPKSAETHSVDENRTNPAATKRVRDRVIVPGQVVINDRSGIRSHGSKSLRLSSLVSCPVHLVPATTERERLRLHNMHEPSGERVRQQLVVPGVGPVDRDEIVKGYEPHGDQFHQVHEPTGERVREQPVAPGIGPVERDEIVHGYQYERGRYVLIDPGEVRALRTESSEVIELAVFVDREAVDPIYFDTHYYLCPGAGIGAEAFRVISEAMAHSGKVGIGRVVISGRERSVLIEPRDGGLLMSTLRSVHEVRVVEFSDADNDVDADMLLMAEKIIEQKTGDLGPDVFRDRYQDALRALVESKIKDLPRRTAERKPAQIINLMDALRRSLAQEETVSKPKQGPRGRKRGTPASQRDLLLPVEGGRGKRGGDKNDVVATRRRRSK